MIQSPGACPPRPAWGADVPPGIARSPRQTTASAWQNPPTTHDAPSTRRGQRASQHAIRNATLMCVAIQAKPTCLIQRTPRSIFTVPLPATYCRRAPPPEDPAAPTASRRRARTHSPAGAAAPPGGAAHTTPPRVIARAGPALSSSPACPGRGSPSLPAAGCRASSPGACRVTARPLPGRPASRPPPALALPVTSIHARRCTPRDFSACWCRTPCRKCALGRAG